MCACDGLYVCSRCEGTRDEPGYDDEPEPRHPLDTKGGMTL